METMTSNNNGSPALCEPDASINEDFQAEMWQAIVPTPTYNST